jgi:hypothetical protein
MRRYIKRSRDWQVLLALHCQLSARHPIIVSSRWIGGIGWAKALLITTPTPVL